MRDIVHGPGFQIQLEQLGNGLNAEQLDEFMFGWDFILARNPELGIQIIQDPPIWMSSTVRSYHIPPINLFYAFNEERVYLLGITREAGSEELD